MKLKGLGDTFLKSSVPAWAFTAVFVVALIAGEYALRRIEGDIAHFLMVTFWDAD